jgi:hypothetical protein
MDEKHAAHQMQWGNNVINSKHALVVTRNISNKHDYGKGCLISSKRWLVTLNSSTHKKKL